MPEVSAGARSNNGQDCGIGVFISRQGIHDGPRYAGVAMKNVNTTHPLRRDTVLAIAVALFGIQLAAQRADPVLGTWVLNPAKSTFSPGPAPKSESRTYVMADQETKVTFKGVSEPHTYRLVRQEIKVTAEGVDGDGKPTMV